jgi:hypothetical protein
VISTMAGVKFIDVEEDLFFTSTDAVGDVGNVAVGSVPSCGTILDDDSASRQHLCEFLGHDDRHYECRRHSSGHGGRYS